MEQSRSTFPEPLAETLRGIPAVGAVLGELRDRLLRLLGDKLVGLYVNGSLTLGDFIPAQSDLDLLAALSSDLDDNELQEIRRLHTEFVQEYPAWDDRVEVAYVSTKALRAFKSHPSSVANISPGEPLNVRMVGREWMIGYYLVREHGVTLFGPPPKDLIEDISREEFLDAVRESLAGWLGSMSPSATRGPQRYAVLTICRSLYALRYGRVTSKRQAALWAEQELPEWVPVISRALASTNDDPASEADHRETVRFIEFAQAQNELSALTLRRESFSKGLKIKPATATDEPFLRKMLVAAANWREAERDYQGPKKTEAETLTDPKIAHYVHEWGRAGDAGVIGYLDKEPVGAAWYRLFTAKDPGYGFIDDKTPEISMAVVHGFRHAGIGTKLLRTLLNRAKKDGILEVSLSVEPDNHARELYEKLDFKKVGQSDGAWTMVKDL